ncbi:MAG: nucleoside hydrolase [Acidimicrobiia bacterium]
MPIPLLIDCDPGHDDAIALLVALASPEVEVLGVTTVGGNSGLANTTRNALQVLESVGRTDVGVAPGADHPLVRPLVIADHVHGASGMEGPSLPEPTTPPLDEHAIDFLARMVEASPEPPTLVATGPLTNVALFLRRHPGAASGLRRVVLMGGGMAVSNITPAAEFNVWADPEAAEVVFDAGLDVTMVGLDVTHRALVGPGDVDRSRGATAGFVADLLEFFGRFHREVYGLDASPVHDAVAVAHVVWPDLVATEHLNVEVESASPLTRGATVVDVNRVSGRQANCHVAVDIDGEAFRERLLERLYRLP